MKRTSSAAERQRGGDEDVHSSDGSGVKKRCYEGDVGSAPHASMAQGLPSLTRFEASVKRGDLETVRLLVDYGVDVDAPINSSGGVLPIHMACKYGRLEIVKFLVARGARVNGAITTHSSSSPLSFACRFGHLEIVQWLVTNGALVNDPSVTERTPLVEATLQGNQESVRYLIAAGAATTSRGDPRESAWCIAVTYGRLHVLKIFAELRMIDLVIDFQLGRSVLECAIEGDSIGILQFLLTLDVFSSSQMVEGLCNATRLQNTKIMELLVLKGVSVNGLGAFEERPLYWAARRSKPETTKTLLLLGADVNLDASQSQHSAIHEMVLQGRLDLLRIVHQICGSRADFQAFNMRNCCTPLHLAAQCGHIDIVRFLLEVLRPSLDIDAESPIGETALTLAAQNGHLDVVRFLVAEGAAIDPQTNTSGLTALFRAAEAGWCEIVQFLCENGANIPSRPFADMSVLCVAAMRGKADIVECLTEVFGADLDGSALDINTPTGDAIVQHTDVVRVLLAHNICVQDVEELSTLLCQAIVYSNCAVVRLLVESGADVNASYPLSVLGEELELLPLLTAAGCGDLDMVKYLCKNGADVEGTNNLNETALFFAAAFGKLGVVQYLVLEQSANVQCTSSYGFTAAEAAAANSKEHVVEYLLDHGALPPVRKVQAQESIEILTSSELDLLTGDLAVDAAYWRRKASLDSVFFDD